ncbi:MAG: hypothetical protein AAF585_13475 [Verrucomicrobiota bacterium]
MAGIFIIFIIIAVVAIIFGSYQNQQTNDTWGNVGAKLKLHLEEGGWGSNRKLSGRLHGVFVMAHVFSRGSGKNKSSYTGYRAALRQQLPAGLMMHKQGIFSGVAKFFGSQDIEIGDPQFDAAVVIKGHNPARIQAFLTKERRMWILSLMQEFRECEIDHEGIYVVSRGVERSGDVLERNLLRVAEASRKLETKEEVVEAKFEPEPKPVAAPKPEPVAEPLPEPEPEPIVTPEPTPKLEPIIEQEPEPESEPISVAEPEPEPELSEAAKTCIALFLDPPTRYEATRLFESEYKGQSIRWPGVLRSVDDYSYDIVFKSGPGLIAKFDLHDLEGHPYSITKATLSLQLPMDTELIGKLEGHLDKPLFFSGKLVKCDPFTGALFAEGGAVIWS